MAAVLVLAVPAQGFQVCVGHLREGFVWVGGAAPFGYGYRGHDCAWSLGLGLGQRNRKRMRGINYLGSSSMRSDRTRWHNHHVTNVEKVLALSKCGVNVRS